MAFLHCGRKILKQVKSIGAAQFELFWLLVKFNDIKMHFHKFSVQCCKVMIIQGKYVVDTKVL